MLETFTCNNLGLQTIPSVSTRNRDLLICCTPRTPVPLRSLPPRCWEPPHSPHFQRVPCHRSFIIIGDTHHPLGFENYLIHPIITISSEENTGDNDRTSELPQGWHEWSTFKFWDVLVSDGRTLPLHSCDSFHSFRDILNSILGLTR